MIDFEPTEEQAMIRETVAGFAANEIRPQARECDESRVPHAGVLAAADELGLVANSLPEEHGGGGELSAVTGCLIAEELAWGDLALGLGVLSPSLLGIPVALDGTPDQQRELLPEVIEQGPAAGSLAWVEPAFDFDPHRPRTVAERDGGEYVLRGHKCFVPWPQGLRRVIVVASEQDTLSAFLVDTDAAGLTTETEDNMGIRALPTAELQLEGVRVAASARLGGEQGADLAALLSRARTGLAACAVGVARAAYEVSLTYAKEREAFGAPIATKQAIAFKLADMATEIDGARMLAWESAWRIDAGLDASRESTLALSKAQRTAMLVADGAVQVFGGHGYTREYLPEMHLRNARGFASFEALTFV